MNLKTAYEIYAGGPGSGCNPDAGRCGRLPGPGDTTPAPVMRRSLRPPSSGNNRAIFNLLRDGQVHTREEISRVMSSPALTTQYLNSMMREAPGRWGFQLNQVSRYRGTYQAVIPGVTPSSSHTTTTTPTVPAPRIPSPGTDRRAVYDILQEGRPHSYQELARGASSPNARSTAMYDLRRNSQQEYGFTVTRTYDNDNGVYNYQLTHAGQAPPTTPSDRPSFVRTTPTPPAPPVSLNSARPAPGFMTTPTTMSSQYDSERLAAQNIMIDPRNYPKFIQDFKITPEEYKAAIFKDVDPDVKSRSSISFSTSSEGYWSIHIAGGGFSQTRDFDLDTKTVEHSYWFMQSGVQDKGLGKTMFTNMLNIYDHLGLKSISIGANIDVGGYAWAKYGFVPEQTDWDRLRTGIKNRLDDTIPDRVVRAQANIILNMKEPRAIWLLARMTDKVKEPRGDKETTVGKRLLLGTSWDGHISLDDTDSYVITKDYVSAKQKAKS